MSQRPFNWAFRRFRALQLCCYSTEAVINDRGWRAELLVFVSRKTGAIDLKLLRKRRLAALAPGLKQKLTLRCRE